MLYIHRMTGNNLLSGQRIELRALEPEDLEILYQWENDTGIWNISETLSPISRYILKKYLETAHRDIYENKQLRLIIQEKENQHPLGTLDLYDFDPFHKRAALGILIADNTERRKGYAAEALELVCGYAFRILSLHQLYCYISEDNVASLELFKKVGFRVTGTREDWNWNGKKFVDVYTLQLIAP